MQTCAKNLISKIKSVGKMIIIKKTIKMAAILKVYVIFTKYFMGIIIGPILICV